MPVGVGGGGEVCTCVCLSACVCVCVRPLLKKPPRRPNSHVGGTRPRALQVELAGDKAAGNVLLTHQSFVEASGEAMVLLTTPTACRRALRWLWTTLVSAALHRGPQPHPPPIKVDEA